MRDVKLAWGSPQTHPESEDAAETVATCIFLEFTQSVMLFAEMGLGYDPDGKTWSNAYSVW